MTTPERPLVTRQRSQVPGSFDVDDDLSPIKTTFNADDMASLNETPERTMAETERESKSLTNADDSSAILSERDSVLQENEMRRRLNDFDSTFLGEASPATNRASGELSGISEESAQSDAATTIARPPQDTNDFHDSDDKGSHTPSETYFTPAPGRTEPSSPTPEQTPDVGSSDDTAALESMSSSPTAAAFARTHSRVVSTSTVSDDMGESRNGVRIDREATPQREKSSASLLGSPTPTKDLEFSPASSSPYRTRPPFLSSRMASGRSSYSSRATTSTDAGSDLTIGADFALQSGGAVPERGSQSSRRIDFTRTISLGSMASGISGPDEARIGDSRLPPLEEDPVTPFVPRRKVSNPTDTVINRHVDNIAVPETLAREFRSKQRDVSPDKKNGGGRNVNNMTLKEQSNTIDRLMKENWNLKLKITFLDEALNRKSDDSIKAMISENVELRTGKFQSAKEMRELKRSLRDLERKLKEKADELTERKNTPVPDDEAMHDNEAFAELEEEVTYLRERITTYDVEIEKARHEAFVQETEKRKLAEVVRQLSNATQSTDVGAREEVDLWKDLLDAETARREQADEDNRKLREEIARLRSDASSTTTNNYAANVFNIRKRNKQSSVLSYSNDSERGYEANGPSSAVSSTLVEQLRHENAELRREVGAQTSMLTSRNRERERLQQEIEDLKLGSRRNDGRSVTGESIFERSASRAHVRPGSRSSEQTRGTGNSDAERDALEVKCGQLRDQNAKLRLEIQALAGQAEQLLDELEQYDALKLDHEKLQQLYDNDIGLATEDLQTLQRERDEALRMQDDLESDFQDMRAEGNDKIAALEEELEQRLKESKHMETEIANQNENSEALRREVRTLSENMIHIEEEMEAKAKRVRDLELELEELGHEADGMDKDVRDERDKYNKLTVQHESVQNEVSFLRDEQETDKIKIGDLEDALNNLEASLKSEKERAQDLDAQIADERHQREVIGSQEKQEVQKMMNDLNRELSGSKDDSRKLKKNLETRTNEATSFRERLAELESHLKETLGDTNGTRSSFIISISKIQKELQSTSSQLESTRQSLAEKDRVLKNRDSLLESHGLETRKIADLLERERQGRRADKAQHEQWQRTHQHNSRTVSQKDTRITELESSRQADRKRITSLETNFKDLLSDRNALLINLWTRIASICGSDWQHQNSLINNHLPTPESISNTNTYTPFSKNIVNAVKHVEGIVISFQTRIKTAERNLWSEYESVEHTLDARIKKLDKLEATVQSHRVSGAFTAAPEIAKLRGENRLLKSDLGALQKTLHARTRGNGSPKYEKLPPSATSSSFPPFSDNGKDLAAPAPGLARHHSSSAVESLASPTSISSRRSSKHVIQAPSASAGQDSTVAKDPGGDAGSQQRWIHRLRELERRLKAEREARLLDRSGARKRLEEGAEENRRLKGELERERVRRGMLGNEAEARDE